MLIKDIKTGKKVVHGVEIPLQHSTLVLVFGSKGYLMCGYLNPAAAEKMGDRAAVITGVTTIEDLLKGTIKEATPAARKAGILPGMTGRQVLPKIA